MDGDTALGLQGPTILAVYGRPAAYPDGPRGQAQTASRPPTRGVRGARHRSPSRDQGRTMTGYPTSIGSSDEQSIQLLGHDLAQDLMGQVGFAELAYWLGALRRPTRGEPGVFQAIPVPLCA